MEIVGSNSLDAIGIEEIHRTAVASARADGGQVTYETSVASSGGGVARSIVSGYRADGTVFYDAQWVGSGRVVAMRWSYPRSSADAADEWVTESVNSLDTTNMDQSG